MNKFKSNYNFDERDRNNFNKYSNHKSNYQSEDCDLSQKIKSLEAEGLKLRSQVESILHETNEDCASSTFETMNDCDSSHINPVPVAMYEPFSPREDFNRSNPHSFESKPIKDHNTRNNNVLLKKELEECQGKLEYLHQKLKQENYGHQMEREELISSLENLKRMNFKLKSNNDNQMKELKFRERKQESVIECLRSNLNQLVSVNKRQEELLADSDKRSLEFESAVVAVKSYDSLRDLLADIEYHRGKPFIKGEDIETCSSNIIVDIIDKCFKEFNSDLDEKSRKSRQLEEDMIQLKRNLLHDKEKSILEMKNQIAFLEEQNSYLKHHLIENNENADLETAKLREEILVLKSKMDNEMAGATSVIDSLENNLQQLSNKLKKENDNWALEKKSLEKLYDDSEKQLTIVRVERDQAINQKSSVLAKLDATQCKLAETETQLIQLQSDNYSHVKQIETVNKRNKAVENSLSYTRSYLEDITKTIRKSSSKDTELLSNSNDGNSNNILFDIDNWDEENIPWRPRKYEIDEILRQINIMNKEKINSLEKFEEMKNKFELLEKEFNNNELEKKRLQQSVKAQQLELESSKNENSHINSLIANRNAEIERLTAERDYYFQMLNEKTEDLANVKTENHKLIVLLEERCRTLELKNNTTKPMNQSNESAQTHIETSRGKNQILREERNRLAIQLNDLQNAKEELLTNNKDQNACIEHLRNENTHLQIELKNLYRDYDEILIENKKFLIKIKDSDSEITNLCQELQLLKSAKSRKHLSLEKKIADLTAELTCYKNELKITKDEMKNLEKIGIKSNQNSLPPKILNDVIKPIVNTDPMQITKSRLNNMEQQMNKMYSSHQNMKEENTQLTELLRKVTFQNDCMAEELENYIEENKHLQDQINKNVVVHSNGKKKSSKYQTTKYSAAKFDERNKFEFTNEKDNNNHESINQLRENLQESIKEAKKLLSAKSLAAANNYNYKKDENVYDSSTTTSRHEDSIPLMKRSSRSDNIESSGLTTRSSESTHLPEVDRHLSIPKIKPVPENLKMEKLSSLSVDKLISSDFKDDMPPVYERSSQLNSYAIGQKIKQLLAIEN